MEKHIRLSLSLSVIIFALCPSATFAEEMSGSASRAQNMRREISQQQAVRVIVSEAANQGLRGMVCVGEVLRRRGSIKGFYGYAANRGLHSPKVLACAAKAWQLSATTNYTLGADHFENVKAFGEPWWAKHLVKTYEYKDHVFYKRVRRPHIVAMTALAQ